ncbi:MAG: hypothetical protein V3T72_01085 [Thermoanaerobaculia bacterium]
MDSARQNRIAQWVFDTRTILERFHLWLEDVEDLSAPQDPGGSSYVGPSLYRAFLMSAAVTALGTRLFGRFGEGRDLDEIGLDRIKKDADAVSAYALSEALWHLTRSLPENHAVMVCLGEGLMPKAGETPDMGSNPLLGFGRVYARPQVAKFLDPRVHRLINDPDYTWEDFWQEVQRAGITIWGAAIDTLEGTSRFAKGEPDGPMTILHLYDQPLTVTAPYEGYIGNLVLPREVVEQAELESVLLSYRTPRRLVWDAIRRTYPDVAADRVHVWTLGGPSRQTRLGSLWEEWRQLGVHLVEDGWKIPGGGEVFVDSGTYAPVARVGTFADGDGRRHLFLCDGYAASAEAIQGASLDPICETRSLLCPFSSTFKLPWDRESRVMGLDPDAASFAEDLAEAAGAELDEDLVERYRASIHDARGAGIPVAERHLSIDDFFPRKSWRVLAMAGFMLPDPYTGADGVEDVGDGTYRVVVRAATRHNLHLVRLTLRLRETFEQSRRVFSPLLDRFYAGEDYRTRPVKVSDSGRLRNELQTLCSEALEHFGADGIRVCFDQIGDGVMSADKKAFVRQVLEWYRENHPAWFRWLEIVD